MEYSPHETRKSLLRDPMKTTLSLTVMAMFCGLPALASLPLTESTFTEIIQDVNVVAAADKTVTPARTNELFKAPDLVRTGQLSRVELTAKDLTITRIGANTLLLNRADGTSS